MLGHQITDTVENRTKSCLDIVFPLIIQPSHTLFKIINYTTKNE